jgi:F-type H+-transporting ATPase subunit epsilon
MAATITLRVITPEGLAFEEPATAIRAPGEVGYLGILRNHAPLVTTLKPGVLSWRRPDGPRQAARIGAGLLEVVRNRVTVLTETVSEPAPVSERIRSLA